MATALAAAPLRSRRRYPEDEVTVKLRVAHLLGGADLEPNGLPPASILIVRRIADPLPRGLSAGEFALRVSPAWERAARSALGEIARAAVRPAREAIPSNANAVLFADQAELLACFSRDHLRGEAASLWWWRAILRTLPGTGSRALFAIWRQNINYVPAVVARLRELRDAAYVLRSFTPEQARTILQEAARAFDLRDVQAVAEQSCGPWECETPQPSRSGGASAIRDTAVRERERYGPVPPPWREVNAVEVLSAGLSRQHAALAGVSLELCRSPHTVRSRSFAADLERWWRSAPTLPKSEPAERQRTPAAFEVTEASADQGRENETGVYSEGGSAGTPPPELQLPQHRPDSISSLANSQLTTGKGGFANHAEVLPSELMAAPHDGEPVHEKTPVLPPLRQAELQGPGVQSGYSHKPKPTSQSRGYLQPIEQRPQLASALQEQRLLSDTKATLEAGDCVVTGLSGVFFLVNLLMALGIPRLLEQESQSELGLGSWECLELIARCLLSPSRPDLAKDAVWSVLSILDGRPPEQSPGARFRPASSYRLPEAWLLKERISTTTLALRARRNRVELWHPLGFPQIVSQLDQPLSAHSIRSFAGGRTLTSFKRVPHIWAGVRATGVSTARPLRSFLAFLMPFVRWRLAAGLGLNSKERPDFTKLLLSRTGKVWMTATHVDVVIPLKHATSAVRFAGLDADPGWVPVFGRVIKFHYQ